MATRFKRYGDPKFDVAFSYAAEDATWVEQDYPLAGPLYTASMLRLDAKPHKFDSPQNERLSDHLSRMCGTAELSFVVLSKSYSKLWDSDHIPDFYLPLAKMEKRQTLIFVSIDGTRPNFTHEWYEPEVLRKSAPCVDLGTGAADDLSRLMKDSLGLNRNLVFLSYRHTDTGPQVAAIHRQLVRQFHQTLVFFDHESVEHHRDVPAAIEEHLERTKVLTVIIGRHWLSASSKEQGQRLFDENDWVRHEIRYGLQHEQIRVLLVLVDDTPRPKEGELPADIAALSNLKVIRLRSARWTRDLKYLAETISAIMTFPQAPGGDVIGLDPA